MIKAIIIASMMALAAVTIMHASQAVIGAGMSLPINISNYWDSYKLWFNISSNTTIEAYVVNQTQFEGDEWGKPYIGVDLAGSREVGPGNWYLIIENPGNSPAVVLYSYGTIPVNPFLSYINPPAPLGLADYGVLNESRGLAPYEELASGAVGEASIYSIYVNESKPPGAAPPHAASLQLNVVLAVNSTNGKERDYWLQNVISIDTSSMTYYAVDNIWNLTGSGGLSNSTVRGMGAVVSSSTEDYYAFAYLNQSYSLPLRVRLITWIQRGNGSVIIHFAYGVGNNLTTYDNVTIAAPKLSSAAIEVNGYRLVGSGPSYYDAELVIGGDGNASEAVLGDINASLRLLYIVNGTYEEPKSIYVFGSDTAETSYGASIHYADGGVVLVPGAAKLGVPFIVELTLLGQDIPNATVDEGVDEVINASALVSGGSPPYTYYLLLNGSIADRYTTYYAEHSFQLRLGNLTTGKYSYEIIVRDSRGSMVKTSNGVIDVVPDPSFRHSITASEADVGQTIYLNLSGTAGEPPYTYYIMNNGSPAGQVTAENETAYPLEAVKPGINVIEVAMHDQGGYTANWTTYLKVNPDPTLLVSINASNIDYGESISASVNGYNGTPPYYVRAFLDGSPINISQPISPGAGQHNLTIILTDSVGYSVERMVELIVNPDPTVNASIIPISNFVLDDYAVKGAATVMGGIPPYKMEWLVNGRVIGTGSEVIANLTDMGINNLTLIVEDSTGYRLTRSFLIDYGYDTPRIAALVGIGVLVLAISMLLRRRGSMGTKL